ncbi:uncharacterized protein RCC_04950 [Ramularia collo-cygni]|uniref:Uncharacterized protein n=1 Tax=Ramularia collo-cygni TaxID=112498 RepID=A0A2D3V923_9PEZI|nr:uncharacterized protein RCC_04950 [Ramularia collo-cygni]CZT19104.1 uncharacterized protein RCC_04950 [Ramularia collo-cygni]
MALTRYMDRSTVTFITLTAFSFTTRLISTAIVTRLATTLTAAPIFPLAVTASVFEIFALSTLVAAVGLFLRRASRNLILAAWIPSLFFCFVGALLALISFAITIYYAEEKVEIPVEESARNLAVVGLAIAVLGLIPQTSLFVVIWPPKNRLSAYPVEAESERPSFADSEKLRSIGIHLTALSPVRAKSSKSAGERALCSHCNTIDGACSKCPARFGLQPMSSRTRLLMGASLVSSDSRSMHSRSDSVAICDPSRNNSDFRDWDTSAVEALDIPFSPKTFLEPIPGSRPASPANPLDGPFASEVAEPDEIPLPDSPPHPSALKSGGSIRNFRRPSENEEAFYHPLFRAESPAPPSISAGTVITASPFAGEVVSPELVAPRILHSACSSRPASPALLSPGLASPMRSHAGSIRSFRTAPNSPTYPLTPFEPVHLG